MVVIITTRPAHSYTISILITYTLSNKPLNTPSELKRASLKRARCDTQLLAAMRDQAQIVATSGRSVKFEPFTGYARRAYVKVILQSYNDCEIML